MDMSHIEGVSISPVGVVEGKKIRITHNLKNAGANRCTGDSSKRSVKADTLGASRVESFRPFSKHVLELRAKFGVSARILIPKTGFKNAFSRVGEDPECSSFFAYRLRSIRFVDFRLQLWWRGSRFACGQHIGCTVLSGEGGGQVDTA